MGGCASTLDPERFASRQAAPLGRAPWRAAAVAAAAGLLCGCASTPVVFEVDVPETVADRRGRFDEIYCAVLAARGPSIPGHRSCREALSPVAATPAGDGRAVDLDPSKRALTAALVPGIGYGCIANWLLDPARTTAHLRSVGYDLRVIEVDALSGTATNAREIRDAILAAAADAGPPRTVLVGYSKGVPDVLEAIVLYPEIRPRIAAVVSIAGAVGGSPLAEDAPQAVADLLRFTPGARCGKGDDTAVASLRPEVRRAWLAEHPLPEDVRFYSVVALPQPSRISRLLKPSYDRLATIDARNDGQLLYQDQIVPAGSLLGFVNADHWAVAVPVDRSHSIIRTLFVDQNDYPREALLEAILRFVEEDLASPPRDAEPAAVRCAAGGR